MNFRKSKYRAIRTENADGTWSDSRREAKMDWVMMSLKLKPGVSDVVRKKVFPIVINGEKICSYECDWCVIYQNGTMEIWDAKGFKTPVYKLKKKLVKAVLGIEILEC